MNDARPRCEHGVVYPQENCASCLRAERDAFSDKALRFDLDRAGIERREREAVELVELRAERERDDVAFELLVKEASLLRAERDALLKDAERYRWLREMATPELGKIAHLHSRSIKTNFSTPMAVLEANVRGDVDAAIDAALAAKERT